MSIEQAVRPSHYKVGDAHEVYKCLRSWGLEQDAFLWTVVKYVSRAGKKDDILQDLKKAQWYLNKRIEQIEEERGVQQNNVNGGEPCCLVTQKSAKTFR